MVSETRLLVDDAYLFALYSAIDFFDALFAKGGLAG
jgi:hypothetical protein